MYLLIDNYDSFTYNLYALLVEAGAEVEVVRNDEMISAAQYQGIILSPGPSRPENAGYTLDYIKKYQGKIPILGVCLGMQALAHSNGHTVRHSKTVMHGKVDLIELQGESLLFKNIPNRFEAVRYHSLAVDFPEEFVVARGVHDQEIMAFEDRKQMIFGIQFHPESILTQHGVEMVQQFIQFCDNRGIMTQQHTVKPILQKLLTGSDLDFTESRTLFEAVLGGSCNEYEIVSFLLGLRMKGESVDEIHGAVAALDHFKTRFDKKGKVVVDTCGTGGDGKSCMNVSTAVSLVLGSMGFPIVKHGNRAQTGKVGSADIIEALGIPIDFSPEEAEAIFEEKNYVFLYAPYYHRALKHVGAIRKKLYTPTIFNLLGPLLNPADADYQVIGVAQSQYIPRMAEVAKQLDRKGMIFYCSDDGYDEVSTADKTQCTWVKDGEITHFTVDPSEFFKTGPMPAARDAKDATEIFMRAISGSDPHLTNLLSINAALGLKCCGAYPDLKDGFAAAKATIESKKVMALLKKLQD